MFGDADGTVVSGRMVGRWLVAVVLVTTASDTVDSDTDGEEDGLKLKAL